MNQLGIIAYQRKGVFVYLGLLAVLLIFIISKSASSMEATPGAINKNNPISVLWSNGNLTAYYQGKEGRLRDITIITFASPIEGSKLIIHSRFGYFDTSTDCESKQALYLTNGTLFYGPSGNPNGMTFQRNKICIDTLMLWIYTGHKYTTVIKARRIVRKEGKLVLKNGVTWKYGNFKGNDWEIKDEKVITEMELEEILKK
jgi:hypothetical protein